MAGGTMGAIKKLIMSALKTAATIVITMFFETIFIV
jgi:hypothetical protein